MILKTFEVQLNRKQGDELRKQWHATKGGAIILMQARLEFGPMQIKNPMLECAILDKEARDKIQAVLTEATKRLIPLLR